ncbi:putative Zn peptidase (plasmid) [Mycobacterium sp. JS623]|uniref:XRE family transcriptional regulator n=1 Tax=Mycobacterium sp. JS623 TaxID=212767 RepID=UPI0002A5B524|nr:XRE family transcriptional regulator [Mycobacterium sp. JS623]AGB26820.1 putative Zn peptidase [Mycobacterium sp. JS623]
MSSADASALFDGSRLALARQLAGLRKADIAKIVRKSPNAVAAWESGAKRPVAANVGELALALGVEPGFFAARQRDYSLLAGVPHFRSLRSTTQLSRDQAVAYGQLALDVASSIERYVEFPSVDLPEVPSDTEDSSDRTPETAAHIVRTAWQLSDGPVRHVIRLLENHGVLVIFSPSQSAAVDAYSFGSDIRPVVILNPTKRDYYRQRFDSAHELGHLVMHGDADPGGRIVEEQANRFAAEFLMPADQIRESLPIAMGGGVWADLARLKEEWGVSMQALLFRARRLGCIGDVSYRNAMTTISARGWRRAEPGEVEIMEQPSLLPKAIELLSAEGFDDDALRSQSRVPVDLFQIITSRKPTSIEPQTDTHRCQGFDLDNRQVISLLQTGHNPSRRAKSTCSS